MTNEEAIYELSVNVDYKTPQIREACQMAIKALEQQPCEDCISREAVLETIEACNSDGLKGIFCSYNDGERFKEYIKALPSVTPKEKSEYEHDHEVVKAYNDGQAYILDKIKAEVELLGKDYLGCPQPQVVCDDVIKIIDKYRGDTDGNS